MRRRLDQYFTPSNATRALLKYGPLIEPGDAVLECCSGQNDIAKVLVEAQSVGRVTTNDIDPSMPTDLHADATDPQFWAEGPMWDWVISNPPFSCCQPIIVGAYSRARYGVAMLLRLSYLEPCKDRAEFLSAHPPSALVLPRISFTGDGKKDNVTCFWAVWEKLTQRSSVRVVTSDEFKALSR